MPAVCQDGARFWVHSSEQNKSVCPRAAYIPVGEVRQSNHTFQAVVSALLKEKAGWRGQRGGVCDGVLRKVLSGKMSGPREVRWEPWGHLLEGHSRQRHRMCKGPVVDFPGTGSESVQLGPSHHEEQEEQRWVKVERWGCSSGGHCQDQDCIWAEWRSLEELKQSSMS